MLTAKVHLEEDVNDKYPVVVVVVIIVTKMMDAALPMR